MESDAAEITIRAVVAGKPLDISVPPSASIGALKAAIQAASGHPATAQRVLVKGRERLDKERLSDVGVSAGGKVMVLVRGGLAAAQIASRVASAQPSAGPSAGAEASSPAGAEASAPAESPPRLESDEGGWEIRVTFKGAAHALRINPERTIGDLKARVSAVTGASARQQRLIFKGKEPGESQTVEAAGLSDGARVMVLFREGFHRAEEGAQSLRAVADALPALEADVDKAARKQQHRLIDSGELLAALGGLDGRAQDMLLDLGNARLQAGAEAERAALSERLRKLVARIAELRAASR